MDTARAPQPRLHERPADGEANEILDVGRVLWFLRVVGFLFVISQAPLYPMVSPGILAAALGILATTIALQPRLMNEDQPVERLRRASLVGLAADSVALLLASTAFVADPAWSVYLFYPLLALEATMVAGSLAGLATTGLCLAAYLVQLALHTSFGYAVDARLVSAVIAMIGLTGAVLSASGGIADRGRRDLRVLLDLTTALANQRAETETIELLDRRLGDAVGGRVRSVALRRADGSFEILRWHAEERRTLRRDTLDLVLGDVNALSDGFAEGTSVTYQVAADSPIAAGLGLPAWARAVTLVPVFVERQWVGILPVLWPAPTVPGRGQLRLLYGLASQVGLALAQGQLQRVRAEAATDPLTGLPNRRAILGELGAFLARSERSGEGLAVLFCDLDDFKSVNDRRGHEAGDRVLADVAAAVAAVMRQGDAIGRYGGDELLVIAAGARVEEAGQIATRVRSAVRQAAAADGVDVTIGIATYPDDGATITELVAAADRAMYRGKGDGPGARATSRPAAEPGRTEDLARPA